MIELKKIRKDYENRPIIQCDSFQFHKPLTWLYGSNGSGKTTLLKIISGMIPFEGDVITEGISLKLKPTLHRSLVSYATAEPLFPTALTGKDLLRFITTTRLGERKQEQQLIEAFTMSDYINDQVGHYSSGMVKKLSLAMALMGDVKWVLLDEPLITLDQATQTVLSQVMRERLNAGTHFIFTSHQAPDPSWLGSVERVVINQSMLSYAIESN